MSLPTSAPTTPVPSVRPSLAGWVATVSANTVTTEDIDQSTIDDYTSTIADYYGVNTDDVTVTTTYAATGSMTVSIPDSVTEEDLVDAITTSISESLGVHPADVDVTVDMETGAVEFSVTSETFNDAAADQFDLDNANYQNAIVEAIQTAVPVSVDTYNVADDVTAAIEFTVDADEASNDLTQAAWQSEQLLSDFDDVEVDSNLYSCFEDLSVSFFP